MTILCAILIVAESMAAAKIDDDTYIDSILTAARLFTCVLHHCKKVKVQQIPIQQLNHKH